MGGEKSKAIGIFDSGIGGLTVVREVMKELPNENIIYFGDTARVPYGSKSKDTVTKFSEQIVRFLLSKDVKAIIIACNTVSSNSYDDLRSTFDIHFAEVVTPGAEACISGLKGSRVGVIGTEATIRSGAYERKLRQFMPDITVFSKACPLFVPLAEEGWTNNTVARITAEIYLQELIDKEIEALILGCTHYPLIADCIRGAAGFIRIVNPAEAVAANMKKFLTESNLLNDGQGAESRFFVSDNTYKFNRMCGLMLGNIYEAEKVDIERY